MKGRQELIDDMLETVFGGGSEGETYVCPVCKQTVPVSQIKSHQKVCVAKSLCGFSNNGPDSRPGQ